MKLCIPLFTGAVLLVPSVVLAQLSTDTIGVDKFTEETYKCVRFTESSQNNIEVSDFANTYVNAYSLSSAKSRVASSIGGARKLVKQVENSIKEIKRQIEDRPGTEEVKKLRDQAAAARARIKGIEIDIKSLQELSKEISACGKKRKNLIDGRFEPVSGTFASSNGKVGFFTYLVFVIDQWDPNNQKVICVRDSRRKSVLSIKPLPPNACIQNNFFKPAFECVTKGIDNFGEKHFVIAAGSNGTQAPGTCGNKPEKCSLSEATDAMEKSVKGVTYQVLGILGPVGDCKKMFK